jgi:hypothetical protein
MIPGAGRAGQAGYPPRTGLQPRRRADSCPATPRHRTPPRGGEGDGDDPWQTTGTGPRGLADRAGCDRYLRTLADALSDAGVPLGTAREDVGYLASARNIAAHEGSEMTADELRPCLTTLTALLRENGTRLT